MAVNLCTLNKVITDLIQDAYERFITIHGIIRPNAYKYYSHIKRPYRTITAR